MFYSLKIRISGFKWLIIIVLIINILLVFGSFGGNCYAMVPLKGLENKVDDVFLQSSEPLNAFSPDSAKFLNEKNSVAIDLETKVICKELGRYIGWPTITRTKSNELLAVFSGNRDAHVCPYGITQMVRSTDNGKTWSAPETINNTPLDDRDPGILETFKGTLLVSWFTSLAFDTPNQYKAHPEWVRHAEKLNAETKQEWLGNWTRRSTDGGKTWEKPVKQTVSAPHGPIELSNKRLLYVGTGMIDGKYKIGVEESRSDGKSWKLISTIAIPDGMSYDDLHEPHVVEVSPAKLVMMIRYNPKDFSQNFMQQSESSNGGETWTILHATRIWGFPPHLIRLTNGCLLAVYGVRRPVYSERACLSKDGGETWDIDNEVILCQNINGDLGYPASVQLDDGSILTIYYQIDQKGEKTCLMGTRWKLK